MQTLLRYKNWIFFITLLIILGMITPVLADYLGPNRTVTQTVSVCNVILYKCQYVAAKGDYRYHQTNGWPCASESKPWQAYPSNSVPCGENLNEGYEYWSREERSEQVTTTHPAATIAGSMQNCTLQNGWCVTPPQLALSANEPVSGYNILLIEGTLNGVTFACQNGATSCTVPLNEGENNFNYWALSSWGDSSAMGTSAARVDTVAPNVGLDISGVNGMNGWYISATTVTATGSDATSGVASALLSINSLANPVVWQPSTVLGEGVYNNIAVQVTDNAGNVSNSSATISVDTTTPTISMAVAGTTGHNGWYKSSTQVSAVPADATSGVATFEVAVDGAAYQTYTPITFQDGGHTIQFRASDNAGNRTETSVQSFSVDTTPPIVNLPASWQLGRNVDYSVRDEGSGLATLRIVIEDEDERYAKVAWSPAVSGISYSQDIDWNGQFKDGTVAPPGTYLVWIKASDMAGNEHFELGKVIVPEPNNVLLSVPPTEGPAVAVQTPVPPAELSQPADGSSVTTPPTTDAGATGSEGTTTTTHSFTLTSGTAGGSTKSSSGLPGGGTAGTGTQTSMPWLPIAAAAALGTSAVVAKRTETRKETPDGKPNHRFPEKPIPFSLFPKSPGSGKAVASYKLDDPPPTPPPTPPDKETMNVIKDAGSAASGTGINIAKVYSYYDSLHDQAGAEYLELQQRQRAAEAARNRAEIDEIRANQADTQAALADRAADYSDPVQAHADAAHIDEFQAHADELTTRAAELRAHAEELKARALVGDAVPVEAADAEVAAAKAELEAAVERARVEGIKTRVAQAEEAATEAGIVRNKAFAANLEATNTRADAIEAAGEAADTKTAYADALAAANLPAPKVPTIWNRIGDVLDRVDDGLNRASIVTGLMSIAGTAMSALGIKQGETISDIGTVTGSVVDAGSVVNGIGKFIVACNTKVFPTAGVLGKVAGAIAIPLGLFVGITEGFVAWNDWREDGELSQDGKAAAWNSAGGFLTAAGGVAMLIPGGQLVGGILLAAGGVCSGVAWYVKHKEKVDAFVSSAVNKAVTAVKDTYNKVVTAAKETVNKAVTAVKETVKKTIDTVKTKIAETVTNVTDKAAKAITSAGENISKAVTKVTETTAKVVKAVGEKVAAAVTKVTETVSKAVTNTASAAAKLVSKVSPAAAEKIVQAGQAVSKAVSSAGQAVAKAVTKVTQTVSKAVSNAGQTVSKAVNTVTQKAAETVKSIGNTISNWFKPKP